MMENEIEWSKIDLVIDTAPLMTRCVRQVLGTCESCPLVAHLRDGNVRLNKAEKSMAVSLLNSDRCPDGETMILNNQAKSSIW